MKKAINCETAPAAVGPYSHANIAGNLVFVSGQLPVKDGKLETEDISQATKNCMENISMILKECGSDLEKIVRCNIYLTDLALFGEVNEAYGSFFKDNYPSRVCVEVSALPKGATVEIDCIAAV